MSVKEIQEIYRKCETAFTLQFGENIRQMLPYKSTKHMPAVTTFVMSSGSSSSDVYPFRIFKLFSIPQVCNVVFYLSSGAAGKVEKGVPMMKWYPIFGAYFDSVTYTKWLVKGHSRDMYQTVPDTNFPMPYGSITLGFIKRYLDEMYGKNYLEHIKNGYVKAMTNLDTHLRSIASTGSKDIADVDLSCLLLNTTNQATGHTDRIFFCPETGVDSIYGNHPFRLKNADGTMRGYMPVLRNISEDLEHAIYATLENRMKAYSRSTPDYLHDNGRIKDILNILKKSDKDIENMLNNNK